MNTEFEKDMKQFDEELILIQKEVHDRILEYGKYSIGPGYLNLLNHRLDYIEEREKAGNISKKEWSDLENQKAEIKHWIMAASDPTVDRFN